MSRVWTALGVYAAVRALGLLTLVGWPGTTLDEARRLLVKWDGQWYRGIAENGYGLTRVHEDGRLLSDLAFFPLYPLLERGVAAVSGLRVVDAGLVITSAASLAAAGAIYLTGERLHGHRAGLVLVVLWAALPVGIVTSMAYSEALFTALAAWALYAAVTRRWAVAGTLAVLAGLTRPVGVAVVAAVVVGAVLALSRRDGRPGPAVAGAVVAPLGTLGYLGWVALRQDDPLSYFEVASGWRNDLDGGAAFAAWVRDLVTGPAPLLGILVVAGVACLVGLFVLCVRQRQPVPLLVFAGVLVALALTTSGYFGSKPRYLLPAYPLLLPLAVPLSGVRLRVLVPALVVLALGAAAYGAFWLHGAGPP